MKMTPLTILVGATLVLMSVIIANVIVPVQFFQPPPSANARPYTPLELAGRDIYVRNGCVYCHSQDTRAMDWGIGSGEAAQPGDYAYDSPHLVGSLRNGPDLFREGGYHPDDWHWAHFENPRYTRPQSFMPSFKYIKGHDRVALIAYIQCLGGRRGVKRADQHRDLKPLLIKYYQKGPGENVAYLNSTFPSDWLKMPNPVPVTKGSVERGRVSYIAYCAGCHGEHGDGRGPAKPYLNPPPMDFTLIQASGANTSGGQPGYTEHPLLNKVSPITNGAIYYAVLYGIPGSAMPQFKGQLESEKIWDVGNYVGWAFMGWKLEPNSGRYEELTRAPKRPGVLHVAKR
ncbi:MAG: cbb3-type cytochrome c oxidase subunit II [Armatimonadota bacterium]|nr:cbb3-type cytochrome c oxidase subunit II [Armatimonadota bacterium]